MIHLLKQVKRIEKNLKNIYKIFFVVSTNKNQSSKYCWLETTARPPVRKRTTNFLNKKISPQIICQDIEDETPFVKLVDLNFLL